MEKAKITSSEKKNIKQNEKKQSTARDIRHQAYFYQRRRQKQQPRRNPSRRFVVPTTCHSQRSNHNPLRKQKTPCLSVTPIHATAGATLKVQQHRSTTEQDEQSANSALHPRTRHNASPTGCENEGNQQKRNETRRDETRRNETIHLSQQHMGGTPVSLHVSTARPIRQESHHERTSPSTAQRADPATRLIPIPPPSYH